MANVTVTYQHNFLLLGPVLRPDQQNLGGHHPLTATSQMRVET
jgi:hypothetical protein